MAPQPILRKSIGRLDDQLAFTQRQPRVCPKPQVQSFLSEPASQYQQHGRSDVLIVHGSNPDRARDDSAKPHLRSALFVTQSNVSRRKNDVLAVVNVV